MTTLTRGTTGVNLAIRADDRHLGVAGELEALGYDALWVAGGQLDRLDRLSELVRATDRIQVASGIVPLGVHETSVIAALWHDLDRTDPGRLVLGLGGPQQERPLAALAGYLDDLDARGVHASDRLLAALGPRKTQLAAQRSAGPITLLTTPQSTAQTRAVIGPDPLLVVHQVAVLETDAAAARDAVRPTLSVLTRVAGYRASLGRLGFGESDIDGLSDALIDATVAWGDEAAVADRVVAQRAAGADHVGLSLFASEHGPDVAEAARRLAPVLGLPGPGL